MMPPSDLARTVGSNLILHGWSGAECGSCGVSFLARPSRARCGRALCGGADLSGTHLPKFPETVWHAVRNHFERADFVTTNRSNIANPPGRGTRFVGAGLQVFEDAIVGGFRPPSGPLFVPQPVIRLNYFDHVGRTPGTSTAFVNVCTEQVHASADDFVAHLDAWLALLRTLGIPTRRVTILISWDRWRGGPFAGECVVIEVDGIEIGDAILIDEGGPEARTLLPIVDFSFGLERIVWVVNSGAPYHAFIGPLPESAKPENERVIDRLRAAVLMCMAGVSPSSGGLGRHLRRALADGATQPARVDLGIVVAHAHRYWSAFINPVRDVHDCRRILESEWDRARAIGVGRHVRAGGRVGCGAEQLSADDACRRLLAGGATFEELAAYAGGGYATSASGSEG